MDFLTFILTHKEFIIILILLTMLGAGGLYVRVLHAQNGELKANNATLTVSLQTSNDSIKTLQNSVNDQNTAIDKMKADADARQKAHAAEVAAATQKADSYHQQAVDILKLVPQGVDKCSAANDLINNEILKNQGAK